MRNSRVWVGIGGTVSVKPVHPGTSQTSALIKKNRIKLLVVGRRWELLKLTLPLKKGMSELKETCICSYENMRRAIIVATFFFSSIGLKFCILSWDKKIPLFPVWKPKHSFICAESLFHNSHFQSLGLSLLFLILFCSCCVSSDSLYLVIYESIFFYFVSFTGAHYLFCFILAQEWLDPLSLPG